jgi:hypothetical protein
MTTERRSIEDEFIGELGLKLATNDIEILKDVNAPHALFETFFPLDSGRINWSLIVNRSESDVEKISAFYGVNRDQACKLYLREQITINELIGKAFWINDNIDIVLSGDILSFENVFEFLLWPHGHIYLMGENGDWCLNVTFEDDLYFGYAPPRSLSS